jgi:glycosyltransferase involved in cell wall biosynthesis
MNFWIVTPSFNQKAWLPLCLQSVRDQCAGTGIAVHHHVQDGGSGDGTQAFLEDYSERCAADACPGYSFSYASAGDEGMYEAINRGWRPAPQEVDIVAHLNCDEQYLPGALEAVRAYFEGHPEVEVLFGDVVVTDEQGGYRGSRQIMKPGYGHTLACYLGTLTAATFFRRRVLEAHDAYFDSRWRAIGDAVWILNLLRRGAVMAERRAYLASFAYTGSNLSLSPRAVAERARLRAQSPAWVRYTSWVWQAHYRVRRLFRGFYRPKPFEYAIYTPASGDRRQAFLVDRPKPFLQR